MHLDIGLGFHVIDVQEGACLRYVGHGRPGLEQQVLKAVPGRSQGGVLAVVAMPSRAEADGRKLQMVLQVPADAFESMPARNPMSSQRLLGTDARQHQQLGCLDRPCGKDHFDIGTCFNQTPLVQVLHTDGSVTLEQDPCDQATGTDFHIAV
ncbi:hypothetical protein D3C76_1132830 [compost metagenome]